MSSNLISLRRTFSASNPLRAIHCEQSTEQSTEQWTVNDWQGIEPPVTNIALCEFFALLNSLTNTKTSRVLEIRFQNENEIQDSELADMLAFQEECLTVFHQPFHSKYKFLRLTVSIPKGWKAKYQLHIG